MQSGQGKPEVCKEWQAGVTPEREALAQVPTTKQQRHQLHSELEETRHGQGPPLSKYGGSRTHRGSIQKPRAGLKPSNGSRAGTEGHQQAGLAAVSVDRTYPSACQEADDWAARPRASEYGKQDGP